MTNLIRDAKCTSVNRLDGHILCFRELRQKHPNFIPGWLKRYEDTKSMEVHDRIILKSRKWIDDEPPVRALNYRSVLQKTPFTKGGFPRVVNTMPRHHAVVPAPCHIVERAARAQLQRGAHSSGPPQRRLDGRAKGL